MGEQQQADTVSAPGAVPDGGDWSSCYCCGRSYLATNMVRFECHPGDALCVGCVAWLHDCSRPIIRKLYPIWRLPTFVRAWLPASLPAAACAAGGKGQVAAPSFLPPKLVRPFLPKPGG